MNKEIKKEGNLGYFWITTVNICNKSPSDDGKQGNAK